MRCLSPRTVGFQSDGKTIAWSQKTYSKEYASFQLPCGKCIECRLEYARTWAIRCVHEAKMHQENSFITLTYDDAHLLSPKLDYTHFQNFMKKLRFHNPNRELSMFVTGEYGDRTKRPHWHALIFGWEPSDKKYKYTNHNQDTVYSSDNLTRLWGHGIAELGSVTYQSAGYVARYAAKKLIHGPDGHDYQPISKKSQKNAIGKKFLEKYWTDIFNYGYIVLDNGIKVSIPRYYEKWLQKNKPTEWEQYVTRTKAEKQRRAQELSLKTSREYQETCEARGPFRPIPATEKAIKSILINEKFKRLQQHLKGDI